MHRSPPPSRDAPGRLPHWREHTRRQLRAAAIGLVLLGTAAAAPAAEIHRCPQPDGTTRFQDRPCDAGSAPTAAGPVSREATRASASPRAVTRTPEPSAPAVAPATASDAARSPRPAPGPVASAVPAARGAVAGAADSRADYVARNAARCSDGDRRACAAVTCERSGRLDSPACQEAVGYLRGPGWDLRPRSDLFDPERATDEFTLTCRGTARRATLMRARGSDVYVWPSTGAAAGDGAAAVGHAGGTSGVPRTGLPDAARAFCTAR